MSETNINAEEEKKTVVNECSSEGSESLHTEDALPKEGEVVDEIAAKNEEKVEEDFKAKFYYVAAEMENMKKRFSKEKENLLKFGNEKVLSGLVDVVDNLDRTLEAISKDEDEKVKNIVTGIDMVRNQFLEVLKNSGLERLNTLGEIFDPNFHEALSQMPAEGKKDQEIIQEFQKGYVLNGRLMRAAKVVIANNN